MHRTTRRWVTGGAALGAAALLGVPAVVFAQSGGADPTTTTTVPAATAPSATEAPTTTEAPESSTEPAPSKAKSTWIEDTLDKLVEDGTITKAQEDAIVKALEDARPALADRPWGGHGQHGRVRFGFGLDEVAKALGISVTELRSELQDKTIAEIAEAHGIDVQKVIADVTATAKSALDDAVKAGRITQAQADARLKALTDRLGRLVNEQLPFPGKGDHDHDETGPTTTTTG